MLTRCVAEDNNHLILLNDIHKEKFMNWVYLADGRRNGPVSHGATTEETLLEVTNFFAFQLL